MSAPVPLGAASRTDQEESVESSGTAGGEPGEEELVVYGTGWCPDVRRSRALLDSMGLPYRYVDLEQDASANDYVRRLQRGRRRIPTVVRSDGSHIVEPGDDDLRKFLGIEDR